ncbi:MAG TPA: LysM domain-containing protein [Anaerolineales bacterium]|nr:LysM domain-containing protein [Anaerolineales bacterium]
MPKSLICLILLLSLAACQPPPTATPVAGTAVPYQTLAPTQTPTVIPPLTEVYLPTPTTYTYTVAQGDTFSSIAQKTGVSVAALQAANPGVSATALSVGTKLVIPAGGQSAAEPTPTAAALAVQQARCWPEGSGGLWCFALVQNNYAETIEDISAQFTLLGSDGQPISSQSAYGLLDILPAGAALPLAVHFAGPVQADAALRVQVLTAIRLLPGDTRYLPVSLENTLVSVGADGLTASVSGQIVLTGTGTANTLWVLASAYDAAGNVVGVRRWGLASALTAGAPASFDFLVSSLGPAIARVEFLVEARP